MSSTEAARRQRLRGLASLVKVLADSEYRTARQISRRMRCSTVVTYKRLRRLSDMGCRVESKAIDRPRGSSGPLSVDGFRLVENAASKQILTEASKLR